MSFMLVTLEVFHEPIGWSKFIVYANMYFMSVTCEVSKLPIFWLNAAAL